MVLRRLKKINPQLWSGLTLYCLWHRGNLKRWIRSCTFMSLLRINKEVNLKKLRNLVLFYVMSGFLGWTEPFNFHDLSVVHFMRTTILLEVYSTFVFNIVYKVIQIFISHAQIVASLLNEYVNRSSTVRLCGLCSSVNMQIHVSTCSFSFVSMMKALLH